MQLTKFQNLRITYTNRRNPYVGYLVNRSFNRKGLQLNQLKHKQATHFAALTHDKQVVHYLFKNETVHSAREDECHPSVTDFRNDQFHIRINDDEKKS